MHPHFVHNLCAACEDGAGIMSTHKAPKGTANIGSAQLTMVSVAKTTMGSNSIS